MTYTREQSNRIIELTGMNKRSLARHYRSISGWIGGVTPPESWTKDELVHDIVQIEFARAKQTETE